MTDRKLTPKLGAFWHRPKPMGAWHFYDQDNGSSGCGDWALIGFGVPKDAAVKKPVAHCVRCAKIAARRLKP